MAYSVLFLFLVLATSKAASLDCSDQQSIGNASGMADLQQVTTLQYCLVDNCTIKNINNGVMLDIIYTTDSLLVVTLRDTQTSMAIAKDESSLPCWKNDVKNGTQMTKFIPKAVIMVLIMLASSYIITARVLCKKLTSFGMLFVLYNVALIFQSMSVLALQVLNTMIQANSLVLCYTTMLTVMQGAMISETIAIFILAHVTCIMYYSSKLRPDMPERKLLMCYAIYGVLMQCLFTFFIVGYDWAMGCYTHVLLANGFCAPLVSNYDTVIIAWTNTTINKTLQILLFVTFLAYYYNYKRTANPDMAATKKVSKQLIKIGITMGATIGVSQVIWLMIIILDLASTIQMVAVSFTLVQQCIIMAVVSSKSITRLCKKEP